MHLHYENWLDDFLEKVEVSKRLRIVCPFIKEQVIRQVYLRNPKIELEIITRFKLSDFAIGVSSIGALQFAIHKGAKVYGLSRLHSKLYFFDNRTVTVSSANMTGGGLMHNFECGVSITDATAIDSLNLYFERLKSCSMGPLTEPTCQDWLIMLAGIPEQDSPAVSLPDLGGNPLYYDSSKSYYVKFFGSAESRRPFDYLIRDEIERGLSHYACGFPENKKPRRINEGDVIYLARMTDPADYAIFGKAEAIKYVESRDRFSKSEIAAREWKKDWPVCLRYRNPVFVDGILGDCVTLYGLIDSLKYSSFPTTQNRFNNGEKGINAYRSLSQQPYVRLTPQAVQWLEPRFQATLDRKGNVPDSYLRSLPQSPVTI